MNKVYLSKERLEELKEELADLKSRGRQEIAERLKRAKELAAPPSPVIRHSSSERGMDCHAPKVGRGEVLFATPAFHFFLYYNITGKNFQKNSEVLEKFCELDDYDIFASVKAWTSHKDKILSTLCRDMISRNLSRTEIQNKPFSKEKINQIKEKVKSRFMLNDKEVEYFVFHDRITNSAYNPKSDKINILFKDGTVKDIVDASDQTNIFALAKPVVKYYLCYPKLV